MLFIKFKQLGSSFNPDAIKIVMDIEQGRNIILDQANIALFSENLQVETITFDQACYNSDPKDRENGELSSRRSLKIWKGRRFGKLLR